MFLSLAIWVPILAGVAVLALGGDRRAPLQRQVALAGSILGFLVTIPLYTKFELGSAGMQFVELAPWIESFNTGAFGTVQNANSNFTYSQRQVQLGVRVKF